MPGPVLKLEGPALPELLPEAQLIIKRFVQSGSRVLEFGSGHSTVWFAEMGCVVTSIEHDQDWFLAVQGWLAERDLKANVMLQSPGTFATAAFSLDDVFDLVFIDGYSKYRMDCLMASKDKIRSGGLIVLDDSHWKSLKKAPTYLEGWEPTNISGVHRRHTGELKQTSTSIYRKP